LAGELAWPPRKEDLERLYLVERLSAMKIANVYGLCYKNPKVAESTVLYHLKRNGIKRRDPAEHVRKVTTAMVDEWVARYKAGESLKQIAGGDVSPVTVWNHLKSRGLSLRDKVGAQIQAVTKYERKPFAGDEVERAYLMGLRYGDLDVVRHGRAIRVRVSTTHPAMAHLFESLFSPYGHIARYPRTAQFAGYEWSLECDLDDTFDFLLRRIGIGELERLDSREFTAFLAGFFDAEGTIYLHRKRSGLGFEAAISNADVEILCFINSRFTKMDYHPAMQTTNQNILRLGYQKEGKITRVSLFRRNEVFRILELLPLRHDEKVRKSSFVRNAGCKGLEPIGTSVIEGWNKMLFEIKEERDRFVESARNKLASIARNPK
jgi:hypothetical protein